MLFKLIFKEIPIVERVTGGMGYPLRVLRGLKAKFHLRISSYIEKLYKSDFALLNLSDKGVVNAGQLWPERMPYMEKAAARFFIPGCKILEVGTWMGQGSTKIWLHYMPPDSQLVCIDKWSAYISENDLNAGPSHYVAMNDLSRTAINVSLNVIESDADKNVIVIKADSAKALALFKEEYFDFVYVDGSHYYANVKADLAIAKRLVKNGGILCGDDLEIEPDEEHINLAKQAISHDFVGDTQGRGFHPGVLLAVSEEVPQHTNYAGFWISQKIGDSFQGVKLS